jgi:hypothetical protein
MEGAVELQEERGPVGDHGRHGTLEKGALHGARERGVTAAPVPQRGDHPPAMNAAAAYTAAGPEAQDRALRTGALGARGRRPGGIRPWGSEVDGPRRALALVGPAACPELADVHATVGSSLGSVVGLPRASTPIVYSFRLSPILQGLLREVARSVWRYSRGRGRLEQRQRSRSSRPGDSSFCCHRRGLGWKACGHSYLLHRRQPCPPPPRRARHPGNLP